MSLESKLYTLLSGDASVSALVVARIYPVVLPQSVTLPAITYSRISGGQVNSLSGYSGLEQPRIQVDAWATTHVVVKELRDAVHAAMNGATTFRALLESDMDLYEDDTKIYRISMDFFVTNEDE